MRLFNRKTDDAPFFLISDINHISSNVTPLSKAVVCKLYKATPDDYCSDEDNGQTCACYVFSALGFYSVCPATDQYVLSAPLFTKTTLTLDNGKKFIITATNYSSNNFYVKSALLNGKQNTRAAALL